MKEPLPLREDVSVGEDLQRDLATLRALPAPPFAFDRGLDSLKASLARHERGGETSRQAGARSGVWRIVAGVTVLCVGAALVARSSIGPGTSSPSVSAPSTPVTAVEPRVQVPEVVPSEAAQPSVLSPEQLPDAPAKDKPLPARIGAPEAASASAASSASGMRVHEELTHMRRLREVAASDPAAALAMADDGQRRFSAGVFVQEREVIAIEALQGLGRTDAAKQRAATFLANHPESPFADKVRHITSRSF